MNVNTYDIPNNFLNNKNNNKNTLVNIGTKLSDFEEVENQKKKSKIHNFRKR